MPRPSWKGVLRLSLVSCPVYLMPATSRTKTIRLNQVWVPPEAPHPPRLPQGRSQPSGEPLDDEDFEQAPPPRPRSGAPRGTEHIVAPSAPVEVLRTEPAAPTTATRFSLRPRDPQTGAEIEREEVVKGTNMTGAALLRSRLTS